VGNCIIIYSHRCWDCGKYNILYNYVEKTADTLEGNKDHEIIYRNFIKINRNSSAFIAVDSNNFIIYETVDGNLEKLCDIKKNEELYSLSFSSISPNKNKLIALGLSFTDSGYFENSVTADLDRDNIEFTEITDEAITMLATIPIWDSDTSFVYRDEPSKLIYYNFNGSHVIIDELIQKSEYQTEIFDYIVICNRYICAATYSNDHKTGIKESYILAYDKNDNFKKVIIDRVLGIWAMVSNPESNEIIYVKYENNQYALCSYSFTNKNIRQLIVSDEIIDEPFAVPIE
jgi:hypothetical protein